jgi:hypothetical protein
MTEDVMKQLRQICAGLILTLALSLTAFGGDIQNGVAGDTQFPGATGQQESPGFTGIMDTPSVAGQTQTPGIAGETQFPGVTGEMPFPGVTGLGLLFALLFS